MRYPHALPLSLSLVRKKCPPFSETITLRTHSLPLPSGKCPPTAVPTVISLVKSALFMPAFFLNSTYLNPDIIFSKGKLMRFHHSLIDFLQTHTYNHTHTIIHTHMHTQSHAHNHTLTHSPNRVAHVSRAVSVHIRPALLVLRAFEVLLCVVSF